MNIIIPYGTAGMSIDVPDARVKSILQPKAPHVSASTQQQIAAEALNRPVGSPALNKLASGKRRVLVITSDHTRPVPSRITMPLLLSEVREGSPGAHIKILIATGFHRATTKKELINKFGETIVENEDIVVHDAFDDTAMVAKGTLPSGGTLRINNLVDWADLIVAEGFIEPHFFAGFSGGRKSVLPGICAKDTIMYNHNAQFIAHPKARTGVLGGNPLHIDMLYAAKTAGLAFILNVAIDADKKIIGAFAGDPEAAHAKGCAFVQDHASIPAVRADLVVTSNGGYPLDQNIYQAVKGMTAAESCLNPGGVIIMVSSCADGHGGEGFYRWFADAATPADVLQRINAIPPAKTRPDQWEAQILARILTKCRRTIIVSRDVDPQLIRGMHMQHATTFDEALKIADDLLGYPSDMVIIPDGVGVIIEESL
jgi:nickel-dependent lactate racemase